MSSREPDPLADLPTELRSLAAVALLQLGADAPGVLARVDGATAALSAARQVLERERRPRAALLARAVVELRAPVPAGLEAVHPDWISQAAREGIAQGPELDGRVRTWGQRRAYGELVAMPIGPVEGTAALVRLESGRLVRALGVWGRRTLAAASASAPRRQIAELAARLGDRHGPAFIADVAAAVEANTEPDRWARRVLRAVAGRPISGRGLVSIGIDRLARLLVSEGGDRVRQVAQRLPRELGTELLSASRAGVAPADAADATSKATEGGASEVDAGAELADLLTCFDE